METDVQLKVLFRHHPSDLLRLTGDRGEGDLCGGGRAWTLSPAARRIGEALPEEKHSDAEAILLLFAGRYYTIEDLAGVVERQKMIESSVWQAALAEGKAEGEATDEVRGRLAAERETRLELVRKHHPSLASAARRSSGHVTIQESS